MSSTTGVSIEKFARLIGTPKRPAVIDVRTEEDFAADPRLFQRRQKPSGGAAARLRHAGVPAGSLAGGFEAWRQAELPLVPAARIPARDGHGRTIWVTRARPKSDRIACPWLIRRVVGPAAVFLFVAASEVGGVAERFDAAPFDDEYVFSSHRYRWCRDATEERHTWPSAKAGA